jgi:hypothetical protein
MITLKIIIKFFCFSFSLYEFKDENMMDSYNIAICLAPTLVPIPEDKKNKLVIKLIQLK